MISLRLQAFPFGKRVIVTFLSASHTHLLRGHSEARVQDVKDDSSHASCTQNDRYTDAET